MKNKKPIPWGKILLTITIILVVASVGKVLLMIFAYGALCLDQATGTIIGSIIIVSILAIALLVCFIGFPLLLNKFLDNRQKEKELEARRIEREEADEKKELPIEKRTRAVECPYCGASIKILKGSTKKCDYCGQAIEAPEK